MTGPLDSIPISTECGSKVYAKDRNSPLTVVLGEIVLHTWSPTFIWHIFIIGQYGPIYR
jgi:hypothetical protein